MREGWGRMGGAAENERSEIDVETEMGKKKWRCREGEVGWSRPEGEKPRSEPHKWPHQDCLNPQAQTVFEGLFWVYVCFDTGSHVPQAGLKLTIADNSELLILLSPPQCWTNRCAHRPPLLPRLSRNTGHPLGTPQVQFLFQILGTHRRARRTRCSSVSTRTNRSLWERPLWNESCLSMETWFC